MLSAPKVLSLLNPPSVKVRVLEQTQQASVLAELYAVPIFFVCIKVSSHPVAHEFIVCYTAPHQFQVVTYQFSFVATTEANLPTLSPQKRYSTWLKSTQFLSTLTYTISSDIINTSGMSPIACSVAPLSLCLPVPICNFLGHCLDRAHLLCKAEEAFEDTASCFFVYPVIPSPLQQATPCQSNYNGHPPPTRLQKYRWSSHHFIQLIVLSLSIPCCLDPLPHHRGYLEASSSCNFRLLCYSTPWSHTLEHSTHTLYV